MAHMAAHGTPGQGSSSRGASGHGSVAHTPHDQLHALVAMQVLLADQPTKRFVKPEDIAALVLHLCGPNSSSITGATLSIDGGWTAR